MRHRTGKDAVPIHPRLTQLKLFYMYHIDYCWYGNQSDRSSCWSTQLDVLLKSCPPRRYSPF